MKLLVPVLPVLGAILLGQARPAPPPPSSVEQQVAALGEPLVILDAEKAWLGADAFWPYARSGDALVGRYAIRALGRLEDPANVRPLLALGQTRGGSEDAAAAASRRSAVADAIVQSLYRFDPARDPPLIAAVADWFLAIADPDAAGSAPPIPGALGGMAYATEDQFHRAERRLIRTIEKYESDAGMESVAHQAVAALENLLRLNARFTQLDDATLLRLRQTATVDSEKEIVPRRAAFRALIGRGLDAGTELAALRAADPEMVRLGTQVLSGAGGPLDEARRLVEIREGLKTASRYLALRAYVRHAAPTLGCQPIVDLIDDTDTHVALEAIDALADSCKDDERITRRLERAVRVPPAAGPWRRATHAFVAVAGRAPARAAPLMNAFATHPLFWVRIYAVRAAAAASDLAQLERLAADRDDNVREAALAPLLTVKGARSVPTLIADLERNDVQLLRSAAMLAKRAPADDRLATALVDALLRLTAQAKDSSRDGRLALLDALDGRARPGDAARLRKLAVDFDPMVASAAARLLSEVTRSEVKAEPAPVHRGWPQQFTDLSSRCVRVALSSNRSFRMRMDPSGAPIAADRFLKLALVDHYYDRLSLHRVVPDFVVQGGSPGANEYAGHAEYMRDEVALPNVAGSVGLSIRGRNTGDAQFYVNLVDNPRLDRGYTVFAHVLDGDLGVVRGIEEGEVMRSITGTPCPGGRRF